MGRRAAEARADRDRECRLNAFVEAHQDRAVRMAWRLIGGDAAAAEDVAQEAFYKAHRALGRFRDDATLTTWFYRILVNEARRHRRWRAIRERWIVRWAADAAPDGAPVADSDPGLRRLLRDALDDLPPRGREV